MDPDTVRTERWSDDRAPTETVLRRILNAEGLQPYRWSNAPGDVYGAHSHPYHKTILLTLNFQARVRSAAPSRAISWTVL